MKNLKDLFEVVGKRKFIQKYTDLNSEGGVQSRINGKDTSGKKSATLTDEETEKIALGIDAFLEDTKRVRKNMKVK